jgi:hypothetical protein
MLARAKSLAWALEAGRLGSHTAMKLAAKRRALAGKMYIMATRGQQCVLRPLRRRLPQGLLVKLMSRYRPT